MRYWMIGKCLALSFFLLGLASPLPLATAKTHKHYELLPLATSLHAFKENTRALIPIESGSFIQKNNGPELKLEIAAADSVFLSNESKRNKLKVELLQKTDTINISKTSGDWDIVSWNEIDLPNGMKQLQIAARNSIGTKLNLRALLRKP